MSSVELPHRPLTPPEDTLAHMRKTRVLADMNDDPTTQKNAPNTTDPPSSATATATATRTFNDTREYTRLWYD